VRKPDGFLDERVFSSKLGKIKVSTIGNYYVIEETSSEKGVVK